MNPLQFLRLLFKGPTPKEMAAQLRKPQGMMARKLAERMNDANRSMYAGVWKALDLRDGMHVLEIGFGNGNYFRDLLGQAKDLKLHGVDFSKEMVAEAIVRNKELIANGSLQVVQATSDHMPFADAHFDRIFCINVIYFWDDPAAHLREVRRVLKAGGTFTAVFRTRAAMVSLPFTPFGFAMYEKADWQAVLHANGFTVTNTDVLREGAIEYEGKTYSPESLVMTAVAL
ncbi:MAG TPA: class I SAM-dependent methyltransferase [Flavobacteriales bacterium]|nr:class I SAM-dependent methyltransferase [Flavobacteriales bacterium]HQV76794.1 class I SAM-dependent methyltransferase [Flavobacteriales bacterium]